MPATLPSPCDLLVIDTGRHLRRSQQHKLCLTSISQGGNSRQKRGKGWAKREKSQGRIEQT